MTIGTQRLRFLRGNTAAASAFTGLGGELIVDTGLNTIRVQDGYTPGGTVLATMADLNNVVAGEYGDANVAAYILPGLITGNITAPIETSQLNIQAGTHTWSFGGSGELFFPDGSYQGSAVKTNQELHTWDDVTFANITAQNITASGNNFNLTVGDKVWSLSNSGFLNMPDGAYISDGTWWRSGGISLETPSSDGFYESVVSAADLGRPYLAAVGLANNYLAGVYANAQAATLSITTSTGGPNNDWVFDGSGNLTLPLNTSVIKYANGTSILSGITGSSNYGDANVAAFLPTYGGAILARQVSNADYINIASQTGFQLQYDPTGAYNVYDIANGSWVYFDAGGFVWESNVTGTHYGVTLDNTGRVIASGDVLTPNIVSPNLILSANSSITTVDDWISIKTPNGGEFHVVASDGAVMTTGADQGEAYLARYDNSGISYVVADGTGVEIGTNDGTNVHSWRFSRDGNLTVPGNVAISPSSTISFGDTSSNSLRWNRMNLAYTDDGGNSSLTVTDGENSTYTFRKSQFILGTDVSLNFGDGTIQTTAFNDSTLDVSLTTLLPSHLSTYTGNLTAGNITVTGNIVLTNGGNITQQNFYGNTGNFYGDPTTGFGAFYAGKTGFTPLPQTLAQLSANYNGYAQVNLENQSAGNQATADYVITADNGTDTTYYIDLGIAGSGYNGLLPNNSLGTSLNPNDAYLYAQGNGNANVGGNLVIGTTTDSKTVKIISGGINSEHIAVEINHPGVANTLTVSGGVTASNITFADNTIQTTAWTGNIDSLNSFINFTGSSYGHLSPAGFIGTDGDMRANNIRLIGDATAGNITLRGNVYGSVSYNQPNFIQPNPNDAGWAFGTYTNGVSDFWMQTKFYGLNQANRGFRVYEAEGGSTVFSVNGAGNAVVSNKLTAASVETSGNVSATYFVGNGAFLTGISASSNYGDANVAAYLPTYTGNISFGNLTLSSNTSNIVFKNGATIYGDSGGIGRNGSIVLQPAASGTFPSVVIGGAGRLAAPNGSVHQVFNSSDVTFQVAVKSIVGIPSTSTTTGALQISGGAGITGNVYAGVNIVATGNVQGTYFIGNGALLTGITTATSNYSNSNVASYLPTYSGNVNAAYYFGNGSQLTGIIASSATSAIYVTGLTSANVTTALGFVPADSNAASNYGNANVAAYLPSYSGNLGGTLTTTSQPNITSIGNLTTANITGNLTVSNINTTGNITGNQPNVTLVAGAVSYIFANTGNVTGITNLFASNYYYANGAAFIGGGGTNYTNANLANIGSNVIVTTGNITAGNLNATANVVAGNLVTTGSNGNISGVNVVFANTIVASGYGVTMSSRPAFRVYGSGSSVTQTTSNVNLKGSTLTVDYNQGSYFSSNTGIFTAPVAGLYQTTLVARVGTNNGLNQIAVLKNGNGTGSNIVCFWETDTNTGTATHFGTSGVTRLAVGDYLSANILAGAINFDGNDSWTVTYIG